MKLADSKRRELAALIEAFEASERKTFSVEIVGWPGRKDSPEEKAWLQVDRSVLLVVGEEGKALGLPLLQRGKYGGYQDHGWWEQGQIDAILATVPKLRERLT